MPTFESPVDVNGNVTVVGTLAASNLGDAAFLDVGTSAGTVAAGDDPRFGAGGGGDYVDITGDTMTGQLNAPSIALGAEPATQGAIRLSYEEAIWSYGPSWSPGDKLLIGLLSGSIRFGTAVEVDPDGGTIFTQGEIYTGGDIHSGGSLVVQYGRGVRSATGEFNEIPVNLVTWDGDTGRIKLGEPSLSTDIVGAYVNFFDGAGIAATITSTAAQFIGDISAPNLKAAAFMDVGTTAGTVAAGDDPRFSAGGGGADDALVVHLAGAETITGPKTFTQPLTVGANPAETGLVRVPNVSYFMARNADDSADISMLGLNEYNQIVIGADTAANVFLAKELQIADGQNIVCGVTGGTGTKIGTDPSQKIGFFNTAPVVQPANTVPIDTLLANLGLRATGGTANFAGNISAPNLGTLSALSTITSAQITDGTIVNADISASAAIALSKLATDPLARANHTGTQSYTTVTGLGGAATLNVGTIAGTVAAGDDPRLVNAVTDTNLVHITGTETITGQKTFNLPVGIGAAASTDRMIALGGSPPGTQTVTYGASFIPVAPATSTGGLVGLYLRTDTAAATFTSTNVTGLNIVAPVVGAGSTITSLIGAAIAPMTGGTNSYGLLIGTASTQTLWLDNSGSPTTANAGIAFGSLRDTNLYRSAANTLKTDASLSVGVTNLLKPALTGAIRIPNNQVIRARNAADNGDLAIATVTSTDTVQIGDSAANLDLYSSGSKTIRMIWAANVGLSAAPSVFTVGEGWNFAFGTTTGTIMGTATSQRLSFWGATPIVRPASAVALDDVIVNLGLRQTGGIANFSSVISQGSNAAQTGNIRLPNTGIIKFRNGLNDNDIQVLWTDSNNNITLGAGSVLVRVTQDLSVGYGVNLAATGTVRLPHVFTIKAKAYASATDLTLISANGALDLLTIGEGFKGTVFPSSATTVVPTIIAGFTGQTANLTEWRTAPAGTVLASVSAAGAGTFASLTAPAMTVSTTLTFAEGANMVFGTATGTKIGAVGSKLAFYGNTAIVRPTMNGFYASDSDNTIGTIKTVVNNLLTALTNLGLVTVTTPPPP